MTRLRYAASRPAARKWVAILSLLAFFLQSLAVQTHIHASLPQSVVKAAAQQTPAPAPLKNQDPIDQCRLCQELIHAGSFVTPSAAVSLASFNFVVAVLAALVAPVHRSATAFAWQSRAPPHR
jgi:hypothetical protein